MQLNTVHCTVQWKHELVAVLCLVCSSRSPGPPSSSNGDLRMIRLTPSRYHCTGLFNTEPFMIPLHCAVQYWAVTWYTILIPLPCAVNSTVLLHDTPTWYNCTVLLIILSCYMIHVTLSRKINHCTVLAVSLHFHFRVTLHYTVNLIALPCIVQHLDRCTPQDGVLCIAIIVFCLLVHTDAFRRFSAQRCI